MEIVGRSIPTAGSGTSALSQVGGGADSIRQEFVDRISQRVKVKYTDSESRPATRQQAHEGDVAVIPDFVIPTKPDYAPQLTLGTRRLAFETKLGEVSSSVLTLYNKGHTSVFFEWRETQRPNPLGAKCIHENVQRFFFRHRKGAIHPGEAYDFPIIFRSMTPGVCSLLSEPFPSTSEPVPILTPVSGCDCSHIV